MADLGGTFDANTVKPSEGFDGEPLPVNTYAVEISDSKWKDNDNGRGLNLEMTVIDGEYKGRKVWTNLNLQHSKPDTVKFAQADLSAICHATGVVKLSDSAQLHGIPFAVKLKIEPAKDGYPAKNKITRYLKLDGSSPIGSAPSAAKPATKAAAAPPWAAKKSA